MSPLRHVTRRKRGNQAGSVMVEMLVAMPFYVSIWMLGIYVTGFHAARIRNAEAVRECTWRYALNSCQNAPAQCDTSPPNAVEDGDLKQALSGQLRQLTRQAPNIAPAFELLHGDAFSSTRSSTVRRPKIFGGSAKLSAHSGTMCNELGRRRLPSGPLLPPLFRQMCQRLGKWCNGATGGSAL